MYAIIPCTNTATGSTISYASYGFSYNRSGYTVPHLASYANFIGTAESGNGFTYSAVTQEPPFGSDANYGATVNLLSQTAIGAAGPYEFGYDAGGAGELNSAILPYGAELSWNYIGFACVGNRSLRELSSRFLAPDSLQSTSPAWTYAMSRPDFPNSVTVHSGLTLTDNSNSWKVWSFTTSGSAWQLGLISQIAQSSATYQYTWSQDPAGRPYISARSAGIGQGTTAYSTRTLDQYGNVTQSVIY